MRPRDRLRANGLAGMKIAVLGAGAWGTALAVNAARAADAGVTRHQVTLWARNAAQVQALQAERANTRYLPGIALPASLLLQGGGEASLGQAVSGQDLIILATPVSAARSMLTQLKHAAVPVAWLSKGFEALFLLSRLRPRLQSLLA